MDESHLGLVVEVEEEIQRGHSKQNLIRHWEARFRERLEITLTQLKRAQPKDDQELGG